MVNADLLGQKRGIIAAEKTTAATVRRDTDSEITDTDFEFGATDDIRDGGCDTGVDLGGVVGGRVRVVVEVDEEDSGNER